MKAEAPVSSFTMRTLATAIGLLSSGVHASSLTVTNLNDSGEGSLREALTIANSDGGIASTISFGGLTGTIALQLTLPTITDSVDITGPGVTIRGSNNGPSVVISAQGGTEQFAFRGLSFTGSGASTLRAYLYENGSSVLLQDVVISGNDGGTAVVAVGGDLELERSVISGNRSTQGGRGGAIRIQQGDLTVTDSEISKNFAAYNGAGIFASNSVVTIARSRISGNTTEQNGGGIVHYGSSSFQTPVLTIEDSEISGNRARNGGGILIDAYDGAALSIARSSVTGNVAEKGSRYDGGRAGAISFNTGRDGEGSALIRDTVIADNVADRIGGLRMRTEQLTILRTLISDNVAKVNDGGFNLDVDQLSISESTIHGNRAPSEAAGEIDPLRYEGDFVIDSTTIAGHSSNSGRALDVYIGREGSMQIRNSTISGNTGSDEAVSIRGVRYDFGSTQITNSTFSGNRATRSQSAIELVNTGVDIDHATFVNNSAALPSSVTGNTAQVSIHGTSYYDSQVSATVSRSVFTSANDAEMHVGGQLFTSEGNIFDGSNSSVFLSVAGPVIMTQGISVDAGSTSEGTVTEVNPQLQALGYRGGFTLVHEPALASPAIDAGGEGSRADNRDQRGLFGTINADRDLGAVEVVDNTGPRLVGNLSGMLSGKVGDVIPEFSLIDQFVDDNGDAVVFVEVSGAPAGISIDEDGVVSGTLGTPGTFLVTVIVEDDAVNKLQTVEQVVMTVKDQGGGGGGGSIPAGALALFGFLAMFRRRLN